MRPSGARGKPEHRGDAECQDPEPVVRRPDLLPNRRVPATARRNVRGRPRLPGQMPSESPIPRILLRSTTCHDKESTASIEPSPPRQHGHYRLWLGFSDGGRRDVDLAGEPTARSSSRWAIWTCPSGQTAAHRTAVRTSVSRGDNPRDLRYELRVALSRMPGGVLRGLLAAEGCDAADRSGIESPKVQKRLCGQ